MTKMTKMTLSLLFVGFCLLSCSRKIEQDESFPYLTISSTDCSKMTDCDFENFIKACKRLESGAFLSAKDARLSIPLFEMASKSLRIKSSYFDSFLPLSMTKSGAEEEEYASSDCVAYALCCYMNYSGEEKSEVIDNFNSEYPNGVPCTIDPYTQIINPQAIINAISPYIENVSCIDFQRMSPSERSTKLAEIKSNLQSYMNSIIVFLINGNCHAVNLLNFENDLSDIVYRDEQLHYVGYVDVNNVIFLFK